MEHTIKLCQGRKIIELPEKSWRENLLKMSGKSDPRTNFMTEDHRRVRYFIARELPMAGKPISANKISTALNIPGDRVDEILEDLAKGLIFIIRDEQGSVSWAFPITVEPTLHHLTFSTGEKLFGAWAEDSIGTAFVQGRLRNEYLSVLIGSKCKTCGRDIKIAVNSHLEYQIHEKNLSPRVFLPQLDWSTFNEANVKNFYWQRSPFFCSEEHAKQFRLESKDLVDGELLTIKQAIFETSIGLGSLFEFK